MGGGGGGLYPCLEYEIFNLETNSLYLRTKLMWATVGSEDERQTVKFSLFLLLQIELVYWKLLTVFWSYLIAFFSRAKLHFTALISISSLIDWASSLFKMAITSSELRHWLSKSQTYCLHWSEKQIRSQNLTNCFLILHF